MKFYRELMTAVLVMCLGLTVAATATVAPAPAPVMADFISSSCRVTQYRHLCEKWLSAYAPALRHRTPRQLAHAALEVTENRAVAAAGFVRKMSKGGKRAAWRAGGAVSDCVETAEDGAELLRRSVREMERMGRRGSRSFRWHLSNVQTWVSAALTDQSTCLDSLSQDSSAAVAAVRRPIRRQIVHVARLTSNALAFVNRLDPDFN